MRHLHSLLLGILAGVAATLPACTSTNPAPDSASGAGGSAAPTGGTSTGSGQSAGGSGGTSSSSGAGGTSGGSTGSGGSTSPATGAGGASAGSGGSGGSAGSGLPATGDSHCAISGSGQTYYVSPAGSASGAGTSFDSALDFATAFAMAAAGDTILLEPGDYVVPYVADTKNTLLLSQQGTEQERIRVMVDGGGRAEFDFSFPEQAWVQDSYGFHVTGSYWTFCNIDITRAGYQGVYVMGQHNTFENCSFHDNRNTGLEINEGGAYTRVINSDAYRNYDPKKLGGMADGFGPKQTQGPGNVFIGCRAWENSDDGFDAFDSPETVIFERCSAFRNGVDVWQYGGFDGNGNGFKVGGNAAQASHRLSECVAFSNVVKGFDQNNNAGGLTIHNCTAYDNGTNFGLGNPVNAGQQHDLKNNVSFGASDSIANAVQTNNSWNGFSVSEADFLSLDTALGSAARAADGSLPLNDFLRLAPGSDLIDGGVDVGLPFNGTAPDLGAFESP